MKLPNIATTVETLHAKQDAVETVSGLIERNLELEQIFENLQPLLYELSVTLYKDNNETITLNKIINDGVDFLRTHQGV